MSVKKQKQVLRARVELLKNTLSSERKKEFSSSIFKKIEKLGIFVTAEVVLLYWSMDHEVFTHDFVTRWSSKKLILLPVIANDSLQLKEFSGKDFLQKSNIFPVYEPEGEVFSNYNKIDVAIIPGVAFDKLGNRLGHGKAYYDKLLPKMKAYKIGVCFDYQLFDEIPCEETDVKMDIVVSV